MGWYGVWVTVAVMMEGDRVCEGVAEAPVAPTASFLGGVGVLAVDGRIFRGAERAGRASLRRRP